MPAVAVGDTPGLPTLAPVIKQLGIRHSACDLRRAARALRVGARGAALGHRALLQDTYTEEAHTTWMSAYPALAGVMKDAVRVLTWDAQTTC